MLFKSFDFSVFEEKGECAYVRQEEDIQIDVDGLYNDMLSEKFYQAYENLLECRNWLCMYFC